MRAEADRARRLDAPVFIVGSASSGTTLLAVMLDRHPLIACGPELYFFDKRRVYGDFARFRREVGAWMRRGLRGDGQVDTPDFLRGLAAWYADEALVLRMAAEATTLRGFCDRFFGNYLVARGKSIWAEKTGSNAYCLRELLELYPRARVIHLARDGRDATCSLMRRGESARAAAAHWLYNHAAALTAAGRPNYLRVRYEDLVESPRAALRRVCAHLGVEAHEDMLRPAQNDYWAALTDGNVHGSWASSPLADGLSTRSVGRFVRDLPERAAAVFWSTRLTPFARRRLGSDCRGTPDLMRRLGYAPGPDGSLRGWGAAEVCEGMRAWAARFGVHWRRERSIWLPLTYLSPGALLSARRGHLRRAGEAVRAAASAATRFDAAGPG